MSYAVKELFYTLQGEGANTGRPAVFCRFTGCNLWSGQEADRLTAVCTFCDTDFVGMDGPGGGRFDSARALAQAAATFWPVTPGAPVRSPRDFVGCHSEEPFGSAQDKLRDEESRPVDVCTRDSSAHGLRMTRHRPLIVCTGGEPLLQLDEDLTAAFHDWGFEVAIETNGTLPPPHGIDWICVSPKAGAELVVRAGNELKLVFPQNGAEPERFAHLNFQHFFLQPMDGPERERNTQLAVRYCLAHPRWRLSLQTHKLLGIP